MGRIGVEFETGVHVRWLLHGAGSADAVNCIVDDPVGGFNSQLNKRGLWGEGVYFARDAVYPDTLQGACDTCLDDDDNKMVMLCLVNVGLPCVGEEGMKNFPKIHPELKPPLRYGSYVDSTSNPEIFAVTRHTDVYPAYIIHYS